VCVWTCTGYGTIGYAQREGVALGRAHDGELGSRGQDVGKEQLGNGGRVGAFSR